MLSRGRLCSPMDSARDSSVNGIFQVRILVLVAISFLKSHSVVSDSLLPHGLYSPWNFPGQKSGVGSLSLLQGVFPTQGSNPGLPHCRQILYQLSHKGSPRILGWIVTYSFSRVSSWPRNRTRVSCIAGRFFTNWTMREALYFSSVSTTTILYSIQYLSLQVLPLIWVFISWWLLCHIKLALNKCLCFSLLICLLSI